MSPEVALVQLLQGTATLTGDRAAAATGLAAIVGTGSAARIYPVNVPQSPGTPGRPKYPAITYMLISQPREHHLTGSSEWAAPRYQIDCWSKSFAEALNMGRLVTRILDGYAGTVGSGDTININGALVEDARDLYDEDEQVYSRAVDVIIMHNE